MAQIVTPRHRPQMATVRYKVMPPAEKAKPYGKIIHCQVGQEQLQSKIEILGFKPHRVTSSITDAEIIVAAGRGIGKPEGLELLEKFASLIEGTLGVTRPLVEQGWAPYNQRIGMSGRTVRPRLFIACGISGAIQLVAGMRGANTIFAINIDPDAPIFDVAHYGLVGDLYQIVPELIETIERGEISMQYPKLVNEDIIYLTNLVGEKYTQVGDEISEDYAHDELGETRAFPEVMVEPDSAESIAAIMHYANERRIPVTTRGTGTGLCGGCVSLHGGILVSTARLNRILEIDSNNLTATVESGVILMDFQEATEKTGLLYAPDPGEKSATIGANVATNAGGMRAVKYGVTRDHVLGMEVVLPSGEIVQLGGKVAKNSSGYSLLNLIIGSEGTLGIVTKIIVKLLPLPSKVLTLLVPFSSLEQAIGAVPTIIKSQLSPQAIEFMERDVIPSAEKFLGMLFPHKTAPAYLLLRFDGNDSAKLEKQYEAAGDVCLAAGADDVLIADTIDSQEGIWDARGAFLEALKAESNMDEVDVVVPRDEIANFIAYTKELEEAYGVRIRSFGHAGDVNMYVYILQDDMEGSLWKEKMDVIMDLVYKRGKELGGQVSGEHGIGISKKQYLVDDLGDTLISLQRQIKQVFDPKYILNPGKLF